MDLPPGWADGSIPELLGSGGVFTDGDWIESKDQDPLGEVRLIQLADVGEGVFRDRSSRFLTAATAERLGCTYLRPGDVLVARMPDPLGRACIFPGVAQECVTVVDVCVVRPGPGGVNARWLMWALNAPQMRSRVSALQAGTTRKRISRKNLATIELPIPPLPEQRRIVAAIEEQFSRLDAGDDGLSRAGTRLASLRASALLAAFSNKAPRVAVPDAAEIVSGQTPKGLVPSDTGPVPLFKVGDMNAAEGYEMAGSRAYVSQEVVEQFRLKVRPAGTVIFPKRGGAIATNKKRILRTPAVFDLNTMGLVPGPRLVPKYLLYWLETVDLGVLADGSNVPQINVPDIASLRLPLPEIDEQHRAVSQIESHLSVMDSMRRTIEAARRRSETLRRSILERAFRGELVPQDPSDEPASVLLERIRAERAAQSTPRRGRRAGSAQAS